jgi:hypothetical protein
MIAFALVLGAVTVTPTPYPFAAPEREGLAHRFAAPQGSHRTEVAPGSFAAWLRSLPLLPAGVPVHLYDGSLKRRQDVHAAVVDLDVPRRDLQQCADAVMRLRAEYLLAAGRAGDIRFHPDAGRPGVLAFAGAAADRAAFMRYLLRLFAAAGTVSLEAELERLGDRPLAAGDILIQGGRPGHVVLVLDIAVSPAGVRYALLGQSYMPAQEFHVLRNLADPRLSPWFDTRALDGGGIATPEWPPFQRANGRRFPP